MAELASSIALGAAEASAHAYGALTTPKSGTGKVAEPGTESKKIEKGSIQWETDGGLVKLSADGENWIVYKGDKASVAAQLKGQISKASIVSEGADAGAYAGADEKPTLTDSPILPSQEKGVKNLGSVKPAEQPDKQPTKFKLHEELGGGKKSKKHKTKNKRHTRRNKNRL